MPLVQYLHIYQFIYLSDEGALHQLTHCLQQSSYIKCEGIGEASGRSIKSSHSWQDTDLPNTDPLECEGI